MAFKRYAALLAGSALAGSALFAQPAMAEEAATEPAEFSYAPVTVEKGQQADSEAPSGDDDCTRILPVNSNKDLAEKLGANVDIDTGVVTFDQTELATLPDAKEYDLQIACAIDAEDEKTDWKTAPLKVTVEEKDLTFADTTAKQGATVTVTKSSAPAKFENLKSTTEGFTLSEDEDEDGTIKLAVGDDTEIGEATVAFTYKAYGKEQEGSFKVTVNEVTQTIDDVTVTEGESKTVDLELKDGVTELEFTETGDLEIEFKDEDGKLTVDAKDAEANEYTVKFTYKANGEEKEGTFKVIVEEKKEEPKENASSKASSNFLSSFKGLSSK